MTTEEPPWTAAGRTRVLTKVPRPGSVLVRSPAPPELPVDRYVDVRPGPNAAFDGDRIQLPLQVVSGDERDRFARDELPAVGAAVAAFLRDGAGTAAVRFGDRTATRTVLPAAAVAAIERRLAAVARRERATLVTWAAGEPPEVGCRVYDVVVDPDVDAD